MSNKTDAMTQTEIWRMSAKTAVIDHIPLKQNHCQGKGYKSTVPNLPFPNESMIVAHEMTRAGSLVQIWHCEKAKCSPSKPFGLPGVPDVCMHLLEGTVKGGPHMQSKVNKKIHLIEIFDVIDLKESQQDSWRCFL